MLLQEAIEKFSSWRKFKVGTHTVVRYDKVLRIFCLTLQNPDIENITLDQVLNYLRMMQDLGWKKNGIIIVILALRKFFELFNKMGYKVLNEELIPLPRKEYNIPRVATQEKYNKLLNSIGDDNRPHNIRNRALVSMIWDTGARAGEIISLDSEDLDLINRTAIIKTEKSRGRRPIREIFWSDVTNRRIKKWIVKKEYLQNKFCFQDAEALFVSISKCPTLDVRGKRMTGKGVAEVMRVHSNKAKLPTVLNAHSCRHYMGREIIKKGGSTADVSNILGHSSTDSSMIYTLMWGTELKQRYKLFRGRGGKSPCKS